MLVVQGKDPPPPPIVAPGDIKEEEVFDFCIKLLLKNLSLFCSHFFLVITFAAPIETF